ncbi:bifunctional phosphopantothenoylcysteine decarboxylase/phosphopantothenate synthase [uncultured Erythrobacter sp.]|uniref:bifunctional phosphopantothenoylcysteine decarboxylase/phosphopantothenate synthase n=1 Tax=uncultured Erythrobacter sp. TaxID=263913 RepID=UPI00260E75DF|nr:bifunctional phosphopantothenoylcysteine decarboxylase/phosphopantothenate synthase [uncultured Erythrobacter sp.]
MSGEGPKILLVVGGGIAAYKSLELVRLIRKAGGDVTCVVTKGGQQFVTPMSLAALSENQVYTSLFDLKNEVEMGHIELSREADLLVVCPATADLMAKMAAGVADDLATTLLLATNKQVMAVPAMNVKMWEHASTVRNVEKLRENGVTVLHPDEGAMACGEFGYGRLPEPPAIWRAIAEHFGIEVEEEAPVSPTLPPAEVEAIEPEDDIEAVTMGGLGGLLSRIIPRSTEKRSAEDIEAELDALGEEEVPEEFLEELPEENIEFNPELDGSPLAKKGAGKAAPPVDQNAINHEFDDRRLAPDEAEEGLADKASDLEEDVDDLPPARIAAKKAAPAKVESIEAGEEEIAGIIADASFQPLKGRHVLVTAGPTWESIDPVRYIANRSSGKQGFAIAAAAAALGADVTLVAGPVFLKTPAGVKRVDVESAEEMASAVKRALPCDAAVMVAAVADWRPKEYRDEKIKKRGSAPPALMLTENPDILTNLAAGKNRPALVVGFAAETEAVIDHAKQKRKRKAADWIVANDVSGEVMGGDANAVHIITGDGVESLKEMPKGEVAMALMQRVADTFQAKAAE